MNAIEIKNLHFSYGKENVLDGVSLCLKEGRLAILAGENGAGKSTLLRLLLGELPIGENPKGDQEEGSSDGSIEILGQDIRQFKDWSSISYVPQNGMGGWKDFPASVEEIVRANLYKQIGLFRFEGKKERQQVLEELKNDTRTVICYEAPHRLVKTLKELLEALGNRRITICRELTKKHETAWQRIR